MTLAIKINANDGVKRNVMAGGETEVDFDFPIYADTHIQIFETNAAGVIALLVKDTDYTVPASSVAVQAGGVCNLASGVYPTGATAGHVFTAYQAAPEARITDFNQAGDFLADTLNRELDLFAQQTQQIRRDLKRTLLAPVDTTISSFSLPAPQDGKALIWDGNLGVVGNGPTSSEISQAQSFAVSAQSSKDAAAAILAQVATLYDNFDDRYLGTKSADPTLDNDGNTLIDGALVFNTTGNVMKVYDLGTTTWLTIDTVIADGSITQAKMADDSIGTAEIINGAVTQNKINSGAAADGTVLTADGAGGVAYEAINTVDTVVQNYLTGVGLSNAADTDHDITVAVGQVADSTNAKMLALASAMTKRIDATWAAGTTNGGLFSGSVTTNTTYHVFVIEKDSDGTIDVGFDTSITAANIPSGYTKYRRIGSVITNGSSNILPFNQQGDWFSWVTPALDLDIATSTTTASTRTLTVPIGLVIQAHLRCRQLRTSTNLIHILSGLNQTDETPTLDNGTMIGHTAINGYNTANLHIETNTSGQIRSRASSITSSLSIRTLGWIDRRGQ